MTKQDQIKKEMIELQLDIARDQQRLKWLKNQLKDRITILYALTSELDQLQISEAQEEIDEQLARYSEKGTIYKELMNEAT